VDRHALVACEVPIKMITPVDEKMTFCKMKVESYLVDNDQNVLYLSCSIGSMMNS